VKYLVIAEYNWEDLERLAEISKKVVDERAKDSDKFLSTDQVLFAAHTLQADLPKKLKERQSFFVCETENEETLINFSMIYAPYMDLKFLPITDMRKSAEAWMDYKL
jgi:hypothetical protein